MTSSTLPYGSWPSSIPAASVVEGEHGLDDVALAGGVVWWTQSDPSQQGRISLWRTPLVDGGDSTGRVEVTPDHYLRTGVHEYGGGAWAVGVDADGVTVVVFSSWPDHRLWVVRGDSAPVQLTGEHSAPDAATPYRFADLRVHPDRDLVLAVREDHTGDADHAEPINSIVALSLSGEGDTTGRVLCVGADFYASPELSDSGQLAWIEWDHPAMPWDRTRLMVAPLGDDHVRGDATVVLDDADTSVLYPRWLDRVGGRDTLVVSSDRSGWWQVCEVDPRTPGSARSLGGDGCDCCSPMWQLGAKPYGLGSRGVVVGLFVDGRRRLVLLPYAGGEPEVLRDSVDAINVIAVDDDQVAMAIGHADSPSEVVTFSLQSEDLRHDEAWRVIARSSERDPDPAGTSVPESVWWDSDLGPVQGWYYPPVNPEVTVPPGELPPMIIKSHGGPTSMSRPLHSLTVQYWTSRGYALLDVNYGGSSGFGRAYRDRLKGAWGVVDVADCIGGAVELARRGLADPRRLVITGGSAGGFTTLAALTSSDVFAAGVSLYGIADLSALARDTHKFESRYLDGLVGPWPEAESVYTERSPLTHVDRLASPMLVLQGTEDKVVPPSQAEMIADAVRAKGLPVALIMYEGEGHGFRRAETVINYLETMEAFCARVLGFGPAADLPELVIENLPSDG